MTSIRARRREDCLTVVGWIPDEEALYLFTGPRLSWPLTAVQLIETVETSGLSAWMLTDDDGHDVGHFDLTVEGERALLGRVLIAPQHRGRGLAHELVRHAAEKARELGAAQLDLRVIEGNEPAIRTYLRAGFRIQESAGRPDAQAMSMRLHAD